MVLLIIIPFLNGYFIGKINPIFRQTQMAGFVHEPMEMTGGPLEINGEKVGFQRPRPDRPEDSAGTARAPGPQISSWR